MVVSFSSSILWTANQIRHVSPKWRWSATPEAVELWWNPNSTFNTSGVALWLIAQTNDTPGPPEMRHLWKSAPISNRSLCWFTLNLNVIYDLRCFLWHADNSTVAGKAFVLLSNNVALLFPLELINWPHHALLKYYSSLFYLLQWRSMSSSASHLLSHTHLQLGFCVVVTVEMSEWMEKLFRLSYHNTSTLWNGCCGYTDLRTAL